MSYNRSERELQNVGQSMADSWHSTLHSPMLNFEERYGNGYDIFADKDYVKWRRLYHPEALPDDLGDDIAPPATSNTAGPDGGVPVDPRNGSSNPHGESQVDSNDNGSDPEKDSFTDDQTATFQERHKNGYDLVLDKNYIRWLTVHHPATACELYFLPCFEDDPVLSIVTTKISKVIVYQNKLMMREATLRRI